MYIRGSATTSRRALRPTTRDSPQVYTYGYIYTYILKNIYIYIYTYIYPWTCHDLTQGLASDYSCFASGKIRFPDYVAPQVCPSCRTLTLVRPYLDATRYTISKDGRISHSTPCLYCFVLGSRPDKSPVRSHEERRCSILGPTQSRISPSML